LSASGKQEDLVAPPGKADELFRFVLMGFDHLRSIVQIHFIQVKRDARRLDQSVFIQRFFHVYFGEEDLSRSDDEELTLFYI
jgi:hypothetical protein